ncbi:DUF2179 domain-containing protein, partial [Candidatus Woesearchaeota archaeon]|nr:DUF2179 domain-containing protein [Candidatus Woesearchaeota archaeon]
MFTWIILPGLIFLARIVDVSLGTIRVIFISKGYKGLAFFLGFFEVLIWLMAIRQIMTHLTNPVIFVAYALGFATGNYVGIYLESKLPLGKAMIRIITNDKTQILLKTLKKSEHAITCTDAQGSNGKVKIIFIVCDRVHVMKLISILKKHDPKAYYSIADVRYASQDDKGHLPWYKRSVLKQLMYKKK